MEEKETTKIFLKTLRPLYYEKMVASAPNEFTEMVGMGVHLEEDVHEGRLSKDGSSSSGVKKHGNGFSKKRKQSNSISQERQRRPSGNGNRPYFAPVTRIVNAAHVAPTYQHPQKTQ